MAKPFKNLVEKMSPASRERAADKTKMLLQEMLLNEIRQAKAMSQEKLAEELNIKQSSVSKIEHRADIYVSTLRSYIEALGGELNIIAKFPEGQVKINLFHDL